jgi:hypothetical protein
MLLSARVRIRDANHREWRFLPLDDHTEYGDLKLLALECLPRVPEHLGPSLNEDGPDIMGHPLLENSPQVFSCKGIRKSKHSRRMVPTRRSQKAFAWARGKVLSR